MRKANIIKILIAILIFIFIFQRVGLESIYRVALTANPIFLAFAFLALIFGLFLDSINLKILINPFAKIGLRRVFKNYCYGWALGFVTPGKLGEFSIIFFLKDKIKIGEAAAAYIVDKLTAILILILFSIMGVFMFFDLMIAVFLAALFITLWLLGIWILFSEFGRGIVKKYVLRKYASIFAGFSEIFLSYARKRKRLVVSSVCLSTARWVVNCFLVYLVFLAFQQPVSFISLLVIVPLSSLVSLFPITFSGLGIREGIFIFATSRIGVLLSISTTVSIFLLMIDYSLVLIILLALLKNVNLSDLIKEIRSESRY